MRASCIAVGVGAFAALVGIVLFAIEARPLAYAMDDIYNLAGLTEGPIWHPDRLEWAKAFRDNYEGIRDEFLAYEAEKNGELPLIDALDSEGCQFNYASDENVWRAALLRMYGRDSKVADKFPVTMSILGPRWDVSTILFSVLEPMKNIRYHAGPYRGVLRYHLGLIIPDTTVYGDVYLRIHNVRLVPESDPRVEYIRWSNGSDTLFDDTFGHSVINNCTKRRVVVFIDVMRPGLPWWLDILNRIVLGLAPHFASIRGIIERADSDFDGKPLPSWEEQQLIFQGKSS